MQLVHLEKDSSVALTRFRALATEVYRADPIWAPASETTLDRLWAAATTASHFLFQPLIVEDQGQPIARAVAILKRGAVDADGLPQGYVGLFECLRNRPDAASTVLGACEALLRKCGAQSVQAPKVDNQLFGCQTGGFDLPHVCLTPHNPPFYQGYFEAAGFQIAQKILTLFFTREAVGPQIDFTLPGFRTREFDRTRLEDELAAFHALQPQVFNSHPGYISRTMDEDRALITELLDVIDDELIIIAETEQAVPVGMLVCLPDFHQKIAGELVDRVRILSIGILPAYVRMGIGTLMGVHLMRNLLRKPHLFYAEASLVLEDNVAPQELANRFRAKLGRQFSVFQKSI
jgi:hypothetical protein